MRNKKLKSLIILSLLMVVMLTFMMLTISCTEENKFTVRYVALEGGTIDGKTVQTALKDGDTTIVKAKPDDGYIFVSWSDGKTNPIRQDFFIQEDLTIIAVFKKTEDMAKLTVTYKAGKGGTIDRMYEYSQEIVYGNDAETVTAMPLSGYKFVRWSDGVDTEERTDTNILSEFEVMAIFTKIPAYMHLQIEYIAGEGGTINDEPIQIQNVLYGQDAEAVTATPDSGYEFVKWSDGVETAERTDEEIMSEFIVMAIFKRVSTVFNYIYNYTTGGNEIKNVEVRMDNYKSAMFATPQRQFFNFAGWYLDSKLNTKVADDLGKLVNVDIFEKTEQNLYAKWEVINQPTYKILIVIVTEINATLTTMDNRKINVNYALSDLELQIVSYIPQMVEDKLNEMMEGYVTFEVDSYYTTETVRTESFHENPSSIARHYWIRADKIPEIEHMISSYRSILTVFNMNDYQYLLHGGSGISSLKYAAIYLDSWFSSIFATGGKLENLLDLSYKWWNNILDTCIHEFTHTVEQFYTLSVRLCTFHNTLAYYNYNLSELEVIKLYLLNQADVGIGELVGIPFIYWTNNPKTFTYEYNGATGGNGEDIIEVNYGNIREGLRFTVPTKEGYVFDGWFLDEAFTLRASTYYGTIRMRDENGKSLSSLTLFDVTSAFLYAKWIPV